MSELRVAFKHRIGDLDLEVDLNVRSGERLAIVGQSGCGKTTLLRVALGFEPCANAEILLAGRDLSTLASGARGMGWVPQGGALVGHLNVFENVALGLKARGVKGQELEARVNESLNRVALSHRALAPVATLSGGEVQRAALARAIVWGPKALLLDEPFSALDSTLRQQLRRVLVEVCESLNIPVLIVTHDAGDIEGFATAVAKFEQSASLATCRFGAKL